MNVHRVLPISFSGPFAEREIIPLSHFNRTDVAKVVSALNHKVRIGESTSIHEVFGFWFNPSNGSARELFDSIIEYYHKIGFNHNQLTVLSLWSNLELMNLLLAQTPDEKKDLSKDDFETNLFLHYLKINDKFIVKSDNLAREVNFADYDRIEDYLARFHISNGINNFEITYTNVRHTLIANFYKSYLLLSFLESDYNNLLTLFLKDYNVSSKEEFLKSIIPIASHANEGEASETGVQFLKVESNVAISFLDQLVANSESIHESLEDFVHLRAKPLFKIKDNEYLIIDRGLAINRLFNSIFFDALKIIKEKRAKVKGDFFGIYTYNFIEKYLSYLVLDKIFRKKGYKVLSGDEILSKHDLDTEPDYYVRNGKKVFIFEIKGSVVRGDVKQSFSWATIEKEVRKKFYSNLADKKALLQLIERIEILVDNKKKERFDELLPNNFIVFPIILATDHSLSTIGVNHILNTWFEEEVAKSKILSPIKNRLKKLVLINIDTLIVYSEYFKEKSGSFEELLNLYIDRIDRGRISSISKKSFPDVNVAQYKLEQRINDILIPFSIHAETKIGNPKMIKEFMEFAGKLFK